MTFEDLNLIEPIRKALQQEGYTTPTPIQAEAIPIVTDGYDLLGCAQTGTGKTAAFSIPIIQKLYNQQQKERSRGIKALILTPTRELAIQIDESFEAYGRYANLRHAVFLEEWDRSLKPMRCNAGWIYLSPHPDVCST
jgi:Superfamily II DNA and RNA helicases